MVQDLNEDGGYQKHSDSAHTAVASGPRSSKKNRRTPAATTLRPIIETLLGPTPPVHVICWDGSSLGDAESQIQIRISSPSALRRLLWAPGELGLSRAFVAGEIDLQGSIFNLLALRDLISQPLMHGRVGLQLSAWPRLVLAAIRSGSLAPPPPPPPQEARVRGGHHSRARDRAAVAHHYDIGNDFYRLLLGPTLTYSCGYFRQQSFGLDEAQEAKYELVCSKLGLRPGMRLLDIGCGFGGMVLHAALHHGVRAVGVTISPAQQAFGTERIAAAGLSDRVEIRLADYRDIDDGPYQAVSSIGMFEHIGLVRLREYFAGIRRLLDSGGRLLNHAISVPVGTTQFDPNSFIGRYVFPDGELHEVGSVVSAMQLHGLEVRDVESLREHYARTTRAWVANLENHWDQAQTLVGPARARIWRLYLAGSTLGFEAGRVSIHQTLAVKTHADGTSDMPLTRASFMTRPV